MKMRKRKMEENTTGKVTVFVLLKLLICSYLITGLALLLLAMVLYKFHLSDTVVNGAIIAIYIISTFFTGLMSGKIIGNRKYLWGLCLGGMYYLVLMILSFLFGGISGESSNIITTLLLCAGSGMLGGMLG